MRELKGKVVVITGASRGIGVDIAKAFAARGARLALAARSKEELERVRDELIKAGAEVIAVPTDVGVLESLRKLVVEVERSLGPIDVLVNNAGIEQVADFEATSFETIESILRVNVTGTVWLTRLVVPSMIARRSGHIVSVSSVAGVTAVPHNAVYSASKHALVGFSRSLRAELTDHDVEVTVVCPGFVRGGMFLQWAREPPKAAGIVTAQQVADATVDAVVRNRGEAIVAPGLARIADWLTAIAPDFAVAAMRRMGVVDFLREQARLNALKDGAPEGAALPAGSKPMAESRATKN